jgi:hypothetical protein
MNKTVRWVKRLAARGGQPDELLREEWNEMIDPVRPYKLVIRQVLEIQGQPGLAVRDRAEFGAH